VSAFTGKDQTQIEIVLCPLRVDSSRIWRGAIKGSGAPCYPVSQKNIHGAN
jgi:hypothetical protein